MSTGITDKRFSAVPRRAATAFAAALIGSLIAAGSASAQVAPPPETTTTTTPAAPAYSQVFPLPGAHTFNQGFGAARGKRGHQGNDIFAACGEPLVAVSNASIVFKGVHPAAGNYLVIRYKKLKQDYAYMHMQYPAGVPKKGKVTVGQIIGYVGDTGNASGCHLHFELWSGKWYRGGRPIDALPALTFWDTYS